MPILTEHSRVDRKYSLQASSFHIQLILRKQKDRREVLQASSTLDAKTTMIHSFSIQIKSMFYSKCDEWKWHPQRFIYILWAFFFSPFPSLLSLFFFFIFAVQQSFTRKDFIENPCLGIYSGLCHKLWQHRTSLLLYNSKYFNKVITIKSTALFSWSRAGEPSCSPRYKGDKRATKASFDEKAKLGFGREGSSFPPKNTMLK